MNNIDTIRIIGYNPCSLVDGDGLREVWYIAECTHHCKGCQNVEYWTAAGTTFKIQKVIDKMNENPKTDITLSGGDGLTVQYENTLELLKQIKKQTSKNVWVYTGYTYEELLNSDKKECLKYIDVLCDGPFIEKLKSPSKPWVGSENQRVINVQESLKQNKIILL